MHKKIIESKLVTVHYKCPLCGAKCQEPLKDVTDTTFLCDKCDNMENYMKIVGVSIKESKTKKNVKFEEICLTCHIFDKSQRRSRKCAVPYSCPGINWNEARKQRAIRRNGRWS